MLYDAKMPSLKDKIREQAVKEQTAQEVPKESVEETKVEIKKGRRLNK